jgi:hypothetical protein
MLISTFYAYFMLISAFYADQANYKNSALNAYHQPLFGGSYMSPF